ncbi:MAG: hypothetical protein GY832_26505, partial [Chloroflexi bacterium]|nr:hypothetical protein [Chloroflexota bacterium]
APTGDGDPVYGEGGQLAVGFNLYESEEIIVLNADPRAGRDYRRQGDDDEIASESGQCRRCQWPSYLPDPEDEDDPEHDRIIELLAAGPYLRAFLIAEECDQEDGCSEAASDAARNTFEAITYFESLGNNYYQAGDSDQENEPPIYPLPTGTATVAAWADAIPSPVQVSLAEPAQNPSMWSPGEAGVAISLVAGDALQSTVDYSVPGRRLSFTVDRTSGKDSVSKLYEGETD